MMAKDKDLNDILREAEEKGVVIKLHSKKIEDQSEPFQLYNPQKTLEKMNKDHAFIKSYGGRSAIMCDIYDETIQAMNKEFQSPDSIILRYSNEQIPAEGGRKELVTKGKWWLEHPGRKEYATVMFEPDLPPGENTVKVDGHEDQQIWNLWIGFAVKPERGCWKTTLGHIYRILCKSDREKFKYFIRWMAWAFQNPGTRAEAAVIVKGAKGAGKGFIFTQMYHMFGRHGMTITDLERLTGKHNEHLMRTCFLFADEAYYPERGAEGVLKALVTEPKLSVEPKFQHTRMANNHLHMAISTNNEALMPVDIHERRYFIVKASSRYAANVHATPSEIAQRMAYYKKLWGEMENGGRAAMLHDLLSMKLVDDVGDPWHPRNPPKTVELREQMEITLNRREKHLQLFLELGKFPGVKDSGGQYIVQSSILMEYMNNIDPNGHKVTPRLKAELLEKIGGKRVKQDQMRHWVLPELGDARKLFNENIAPINWSDYDPWELGITAQRSI